MSIHFGGLVGYSGENLLAKFYVQSWVCHSPSGKMTLNLNRPPSHKVFSLPGMPHSQFFRSRTPFSLRCGFA